MGTLASKKVSRAASKKRLTPRALLAARKPKRLNREAGLKLCKQRLLRLRDQLEAMVSDLN